MEGLRLVLFEAEVRSCLVAHTWKIKYRKVESAGLYNVEKLIKASTVFKDHIHFVLKQF